MFKNRNKRDGFTEFMFEYVIKELNAGRTYLKSQYRHIAKPHWEELSQLEKNRYEAIAMAKSPFKRFKRPSVRRYMPSPAEFQSKQKEMREKEEFMKITVQNMVRSWFETKAIAVTPLIFIMANYFYKTLDLCYSPAEIAVGKFTLKSGLQKVYHSFINPGIVKVGHAFEAKYRSERIHHLPPPPRAFGETDYNVIYQAVLNVIGITANEKYAKDDARRPRLFVRKEDIQMMESILDTLSHNMDWRNLFDLFELEYLFYELKNAVEHDPENPDEKLPYSVTSYFIELDHFDWTADISCKFHEDEDASCHCALSYVRRWFFLFADHIAEKIGIEVIPGIHIPACYYFISEDDECVDHWNDSDRGNGCAVQLPKQPMKQLTQDDDSSDEEFISESHQFGYTRLEECSDTDSDSDSDYYTYSGSF